MTRQTECKYCGCDDVSDGSEAFVHFRCGTAYWPGVDQWTYANKCVGKCAERVAELEERIKQAVGMLDDITSDAWEEGLQDATRFLRGNSSKSSNSSPVTTDDLASSDYYEAVRQRVPWMVAVEHIKGLVEGYRRCGVMVWQAAEHIQRIYGGEHGKTD